MDVYDKDPGGGKDFMGCVTMTGLQVLKNEHGGHENQLKLRGRRGAKGSSNYLSRAKADKGVKGCLFVAFNRKGQRPVAAKALVTATSKEERGGVFGNLLVHRINLSRHSSHPHRGAAFIRHRILIERWPWPCQEKHKGQCWDEKT